MLQLSLLQSDFSYTQAIICIQSSKIEVVLFGRLLLDNFFPSYRHPEFKPDRMKN